ncbi:CMRF35-like molecule 7 isoform X2 [Amia ocellicauda]|uniref:CMRF35-like molecule 7 isoform X2 n=1 Tax=Amia ocellicauda TaxID=2972642 RepID=UPI0034647C49
MNPRSVMGPSLLLLMTLVTGWCAEGPTQELRVPPGGNVTLHCRYSIPRYRLHVKTWSRRKDIDGFEPLADTNGYLALSHRGRLAITDLKKSGMVSVSMTALRESDSGEYWCAVRMLYGVEGLSCVTLHVSAGGNPGSESSGTAQPESLLPVARETLSSAAGRQGGGHLWGVLRWVLFGVMVVCPVLVNIIVRSCRDTVPAV